MNPLWFFVGLEIGDRLRENPQTLARLVPKPVKTVVRETYWWVDHKIQGQRLISAHHRFLRELPVKGGE